GDSRARLDAAALDPRELALAPQPRLDAASPALEALARSSAPEAHDIPGDEARIGREARLPTDIGERVVVEDGFLRQPFHGARAFRVDRDAAARPGPGGSIPFGGARCREKHRRALARLDLDQQL